MSLCGGNPFLHNHLNIAVFIQDLHGRAFDCFAIGDIDRRGLNHSRVKLDQNSAVCIYCAVGSDISLSIDTECRIRSNGITIGCDGGAQGIRCICLQTFDLFGFHSGIPFHFIAVDYDNITGCIEDLQMCACQFPAIGSIDSRDIDRMRGRCIDRQGAELMIGDLCIIIILRHRDLDIIHTGLGRLFDLLIALPVGDGILLRCEVERIRAFFIDRGNRDRLGRAVIIHGGINITVQMLGDSCCIDFIDRNRDFVGKIGFG